MKSIKMNTLGGFVSLAAIFAVTMAQPAQNTSVEAVIEGINQFAPTFFREVTSSDPGNLIISSLSTSIALAMFAYGSRGKTKEEFIQVLHLPEESVGKIGYANLIDSINAAENVQLRLANKVFISKEFTVERSYRNLIKTTFRSAFQNLDFIDTQEAVNTINEWVNENTNNRQTEALTPDILPETPNMALVNVIYFKADWDGLFRRLQGGKKPFHVTKSQWKPVYILHNRGYYRYGILPELEASFVEIPYENKEFSMIIILPDAIEGLDEVEEKLGQQDLTKLIETANVTKVDVSIPKFKIESTLNLIPPLKSLGLKRAFNEDSADFTEIFDIGLYIDSFVQKAVITVDGTGSESTASLRSASNSPALNTFYVDHSFHLSILKKDTLTNKKFELFSARVVDPTK